MMSLIEDYLAVSYDDADNALILIDQSLLPGQVVRLRLHTLEETWESIRSLRVRGAPAIGVAAAFGVYIALLEEPAKDHVELEKRFAIVHDRLASARPTAVNLFWALRRMERCYQENRQLPVPAILERLLAEAKAIRDEDTAMCRSIGEHGLSLLKPGMGLLTHCNAGQLAASRYGTALAPIHVGNEKGYGFKVYADETRPLLQGARLTAFELQASGVDVTVICDNMAATVLKNGWVEAVLVGADRIAANGDTANKIGTSGLAIMAKYYNVPVYVLAPTSTIDYDCPDGDAIPIEQRAAEEVTSLWYRQPMAPEGVAIFNPAFDVTPHSLITAIITEQGIARPPFASQLAAWK